MKVLTVMFLPVLFILSACSSEDSLQLIDQNAEIVTNEDVSGSTMITEGKQKGKEIVPTVLLYTFRMENTDVIGVGDHEQFELEIVPDEELTDVTEDVMGTNIFKLSEPGLGSGISLEALPSSEKGKWQIYYDLGAEDENPEVPLLPDEKKLEELEKHALHATLVVKEDGDEIARFDLRSG